ncbi:MAG: hypothetical protein IT260_21480 [Saprospiraceae bacterium]|nr:hypothetical protein [Saprospiraceae bacterium]
MRAESLAQPEFFPRRYSCQGLLLAELPTGLDTTHGVLLDPEKKALYCTCPFLPKPCVHARALSLLFDRMGASLFEPIPELPEWAAALAAGRPARLQATAAGGEAARAQRHAQRIERATQGFEDLENWLLDTLRRGIATAVSEDPAFYQQIAGRLADASMSALSRNFRTLSALPPSAPDWAERTLDVLAEAALALQAFRQRALLPEALLSDLEAFIGITLKKDTVLAQGSPVHDTWAVAGVWEEPLEDKLRLRRSWLLGAQSQRFALLLDHGYGELPPGFLPGALLSGSLVYYPSAWPQRALVADEWRPLSRPLEKLPGYPSIAGMTLAYATALAAQPWLSYFPAVLLEVRPFRVRQQFGLLDPDGHQLPLANPTADAWALLALSAGSPITVFGEWDGHGFRVLSALDAGRLVRFDR